MTGIEILRAIIVMGAFFAGRMSQSKRIRELEDKISILERRTIWK